MHFKLNRVLPIVGVAALAGSALLISADKPEFGVNDKAYYADSNLVNFVRPGLVIKVTGASITTDGAITARVKLTDPKGLPLDRVGVTTPGAVSVSLIAAYIPKGQKQYVAYTTRAQVSPINGVSAIQGSADSGGAWQDAGNGEYVYTFKTRAPKGFEATSTHSIGAYGSRDLTEFDMGTQYDDDVYNFVPDGSKVTVVHDVVRTATCNKCHDQMGFHGGSRRTVEMCILCHNPQSVDPDTGNTVDMAVFIHKIHAGATLPSVVAGGKYQIIGHSQTVADYSDIVFPADARNCAACHDGTATQQDNMFNASRTACGSCHDDVNFATGKNHVDLPQVSDNQCTTCHIKKGEVDFDASILGAHLIPRFSANLPGVSLEIVAVNGNKPGEKVTVSFRIRNKKGEFVSPGSMARLNVLLTGPNTDYALPGVAAGYVTESAIKATGDGQGTYWWTLNTPLPANATGSYTVAMEGRQETKLLPGTKQEILVRDTAVNKQLAFSVDGSKVQPRRTVVTTAQCNACHASLAFHGDNRNDVNSCVICHNPVGVGGKASIDFRTMIHRIHTGVEMTRDYTIGTSNFNEIGYPGDRRNCGACHVNNSQQLPLGENLMPVADPSGYMTSVPATTAACTSCHDTKSVTAHAAANTNKGVESCDVCHGPNADFSLNKAHAR